MQISNISNSLMSAQMDEQAKAAAEAKAAKEDAKLRKACQGFEAMFMNMMYKEMRKTVPKNGFWGNSNAEQIWQDMMDTEMVDKLSEAGGIGIADMMYKQMKQDIKDMQDMELRAQKAEADRLRSLNIKV